jgi:hypothetical protein
MKAHRTTVAAVLAGAILLLGAVRLMAQTGPSRFFGPLSRVITPNGDRKNDIAFFCFDNPSSNGIVGRIYTMLGTEVAATGPRTAAGASACPTGFNREFVTWDGKSNGSPVRSGVYVYRLEIEGKIHTGTVLVVR